MSADETPPAPVPVAGPGTTGPGTTDDGPGTTVTDGPTNAPLPGAEGDGSAATRPPGPGDGPAGGPSAAIEATVTSAGAAVPGRGPAPSGQGVAGADRRGWLARHRWVVPTVLVGLVVAIPLRGVFRAPGPPMEEGFMIVFPERLLHGDIPNKDFLHLYGPGSIWTIAGFFRVFGVSMWTERVVGLLQLLLLISGVTVIGYRWGRYVAAACGIATAVVIIPPIGVTALAWVGGIGFAVWSVGVATRALDPGQDRRRGLLVAGLLAGAALLFRPDLVAALGLSLGALFLFALDGEGRRRLALGAAIGVSPYLLHLAMAGPGNAIRGMVVEPVFELRAGRRLPFPPPYDEYTSFLNRAFAFRKFPWPLPAPEQPLQIFLFFCTVFGVAAAVVAIGLWARHRGSPHGWRLLAVALLAAGLLPQTVQRADTAHMSWVGCVGLGVLPMFVAEAARLRGWRPAPAAAATLVPFALMLLFPHFTYRWYADYAGQSFGYDRHFYSVDNDGRSFYYGREDVGVAAERMFADIERLTQPGDRLIVGPGDLAVTPYSESYLYYLLPDLEPGTRYIEMDPGVANADDSGLADEVRDADVVILSTMYDNWHEPNTSMEPGSPEPGEVLRQRFCLVDTYGDNSFSTGVPGTPIFELHVRCDRGEAGG